MAGSSALGYFFLVAFSFSFSGLEAASAAGSFAVFGHLEIELENYRSDLCPLQVAVYLRDQVWKSFITSNFYVFKVPLERYLGSPGLVDIDLLTGQQPLNLWRRVFVVDDSGGYQADANLAIPASFQCALPTDVEEQKQLDFARPAIIELEVCLPKEEHTCPNPHTSGIEAGFFPALELVREEEEPEEEKQHLPCCAVFGNRLLHSWHLLSVTTFGAAIHAITLVLRGFISRLDSATSSPSSEQDPTATWELWTLPTPSRRGRAGRQRSVMATGTGSFDEAWSQAQDLFSSCSFDEGACFSYNCDGPRQNASQWNRDGFGRLTRP